MADTGSKHSNNHGFETAAARFKDKARHFSEIERSLMKQEAQVLAMEKQAEINYKKSLRVNQKIHANSAAAGSAHSVGIVKPVRKIRRQPQASAPAGAPSHSQEAAEVAKLVLSAIEPQLRTQQAEIAKLATAVQHKPKPEPRSAAAASPRASRGEAEERAFERRMSRYMRRHRPAAGLSNLNMIDYRLTNDIKHGEHDPGLGQEPPHPPADLKINITRPKWLPKTVTRHSLPWRHPQAKGGPCSAAGACDHARFTPRDHEHFRRSFLQRYKDWTTDGSGYPARYRPEYHPTETYLATDETIGEAVVDSLDFDAASFKFDEAAFQASGKKVPELPKRNYVVSLLGNLLVNKSGIYSFCSSSSDRSVLFVDDHEVVANDGRPDRGSLEPEKERCAKVGLFKGHHPVRSVEFQAEKPVSFAATYSGPDTDGGKKAVPSKGWIAKWEPTLPSLWDKWYATYVPRLDDVADDDMMANPLGRPASPRRSSRARTSSRRTSRICRRATTL